jgi:dihydrofolate synthase/folylpolyglutamate synthase
VAWLLSLPPSLMKLGLERMEAALAALGHPEQQVPALHVAGTNGKGSTCAFAESCLRAAGYRVGLYTSPHLVRVNERIRVGGEPIPDDVLGTRILEVLARCPDAARTLTFFEFGTLVAYWHFAQERVDVAVVEVGLGGRLDATRTCRAEVTAVSTISFDHQEYLGHTLAAIAGEKAGTFRPGIPAVTVAQHPEAAQSIRAIASNVGAPLGEQGRDFDLSRTPDGRWRWTSGPRVLEGLTLGLVGAHQGQNAALALAALERLGARGFPVDEQSLRQGLARARWPGRMQQVGEAPQLWLDGAHNPGGAATLAATVREVLAGRPVHLVFGVLADKDWPEMVETLFPLAASLHLAPPASPRALSPETPALRAAAARHGLVPAVHCSVTAAVEAALRGAGREEAVLACGSLVLVGEVLGWHEAGRPPAAALS